MPGAPELTDWPGAGWKDAYDPDEVVDRFTAYVEQRGLSLYPAQEEALLELVTGANVVLATPTGSGKSLVALAAHTVALAQGRRTYYTAPIKALVSEKFFDLCERLGADNVGMLTGDASVNSSAPVICCTAEILAQQALREGAAADIGQVVMDEFHFYGDRDRGWAWQVPLLELPQAQFLLMSGTLGDTERIREDLTARTGRETALVEHAERPVPLTFSWSTDPMHAAIEQLLETHQAPVYVVHFTQAAAQERAQALTSAGVATREERDAIGEAIGAFRFGPGFGKTLSRVVRMGIGIHHAGMLPRYRRLVEMLAQAGLLKVICGTDTLGVGINVPIRTVVLTSLVKYDGRRQRLLTAREFHQIAGRAGRAGFDTAGSVVVQAPDHEVENARLVAKAGDDPKKLKRVQRKKPPEGETNYTEAAYDKLVAAAPEQLTPRMKVTHAMVLNVLAREEDPLPVFRRLLRENHESGARQVQLVRRAVSIYRSLLAGGVVHQLPEPAADGSRTRVDEDLQHGFALNQPLSTYALATFEALDPEAETYTLDVLSVVESTLDDPRQVLLAQEHKAKGEAVAEMKADGIEYEERMDLLEEVTYPKPLEELLTATFEVYAEAHPWLRESPVSPKTVARDMYERRLTFAEYVSFYGLARSEGLLLRYLSDAWRAVRQTVTDAVRTPEMDDIQDWLEAVVRQTDSSLIDEWEAMVAGADSGSVASADPVRPDAPRTLSSDTRGFRVMVRNALWRRLELVARGRAQDVAALEELDGSVWDGVADYYAEHDEVLTTGDARGPQMFDVNEKPDRLDLPEAVGERVWRVEQIVADPEGDHDWRIRAVVDLDASDEMGDLVMTVEGLSRL